VSHDGEPAEKGGAAAQGGRPPAPRTAREMLSLARGFLERKGLGEARLEAELLVAHALKVDRLGLFMRLDAPIQSAEVDLARDCLVRRGRREPTAYIVGQREFFGRDFAVGPGALVPRPETELIVDLARERIPTAQRSGLRVADVGTGSGCLAVTLALELEGAAVDAIDLSEEALVWASRNAEALGASVAMHCGEGLQELEELLGVGGPFDLIVSNPPYVEPTERELLSPEVREHEPPLALYAPAEDPDFWARGLIELAQRALKPGGLLLVELGHLQGQRVHRLAEESGAQSAEIVDDLGGIPRVLALVR
jgi:release factor glutamine methyltransferase